ncbi:hypothetical protein [Halobacterium litoreum]|uniref:Small CPxCG-related zinc finger protein n=1 Tax=Halobacterium litoreum TaxID=2039234 RepID=A0ABD5NH47_9EURY|nr:hypothetical protein [Halobacterium litoreum]UHH12693.1 hypothetical protein LT972_11050 [Halobacterium litoreum]
MSVVESLRRRLASATPVRYECGLCTATYDYEPPNCPACGSVEIREV